VLTAKEQADQALLFLAHSARKSATVFCWSAETIDTDIANHMGNAKNATFRIGIPPPQHVIRALNLQTLLVRRFGYEPG
jgi:hypothetical protein